MANVKLDLHPGPQQLEQGLCLPLDLSPLAVLSFLGSEEEGVPSPAVA